MALELSLAWTAFWHYGESNGLRSALLSSLDSLAKIAGLFDTEKKSEQLTVWAGFTPEQLEKIKDEQESKLIGHTESEKE